MGKREKNKIEEKTSFLTSYNFNTNIPMMLSSTSINNFKNNKIKLIEDPHNKTFHRRSLSTYQYFSTTKNSYKNSMNIPYKLNKNNSKINQNNKDNINIKIENNDSTEQKEKENINLNINNTTKNQTLNTSKNIKINNSTNINQNEISKIFYSTLSQSDRKNKSKKKYLLPEKNSNKKTLVLDLDETLVHYIEEENKAYVQVRPYADFFLNEMAKYFELIIFTAASEDYADIVLNELDKNKVIKYKLYRKHTEQVNGIFVKDLKKIGRDLDKTLIVDNNKDNFSLQPENGLHICSFIGDQNDDELYNLSEDLMKIVRSNKEDIRPIIKEIQEIMNNRYQNKEIILE